MENENLQREFSAGSRLSSEQDSRCARFEAAWVVGQQPRIEDFLHAVSVPDRPRLLQRLLTYELRHRLAAGAALGIDEYLVRFAEHALVVKAAFREVAGLPEYGPNDLATRSVHHSEDVANLARPSGEETICADVEEGNERLSFAVVSRSVIRGSEDTVAPDSAKRSTEESSVPLRTGLGHFQFISPLGSGGFGTVWMARDLRLDRLVAIKIPRADQLTDADAELFFREARVVAQLKHPNIVTVHDVGRMDDTVFIVSDLVEGVTLAEWIHRANPTARQSATLLAKLCDALYYAHEMGVIHRDLKPTNVMITQADEPILMDFGLAKRDQGEHTIQGHILGTPAYMSPEQARGASHTADARSDIYSLGVIFYRLLTGEVPFRGTTEVLLNQILVVDPLPPRKLNHRAPADLETICLKCLEKSPEARYQSAAEVAAELRRWLGHEPIQARPIGKLGQGIRWCQRRPVIASLIAAIMLVACIGGSGITWQWRNAVNNRDQMILSQVDRLLVSSPDSIPAILEDLEPFRDEIRPRLRSLDQLAALTASQRARIDLALLADEPERVDRICEQMLDAEPGEIAILRQALLPYKDRLKDRLWEVIGNTKEPVERRFRAAAGLVAFDPDNPEWNRRARDVAARLVAQSPLSLGVWIELFEPIKEILHEPLLVTFRDNGDADAAYLASVVIAEYSAGNSDLLLALIYEGRPRQVKPLAAKLIPFHEEVVPKLLERAEVKLSESISRNDWTARTQERGNAVLALYVLGELEKVLSTLKASADNSLRTYVIHGFGPLGAELQPLVQAMAQSEPSVRAAITLILGDVSTDVFSYIERDDVLPTLRELYQKDPDPAVHSAVWWTMRQWGFGKEVQKLDEMLAAAGVSEDRNWYSDRQGFTFAVVRGPIEYTAGTSSPYGPNMPALPAHKSRIPRSFAIATREVSHEQFAGFLPKNNDTLTGKEETTAPAGMLSDQGVYWYCRWLTEEAGLPESEMCYRRLSSGYTEPYPDLLTRRGYRLPTHAEWEYACRAGTTTHFYHGKYPTHSDFYEQTWKNAYDNRRPCGSLKPNDFGLFDTLGNVKEYTIDWLWPLPTSPETLIVDVETTPLVDTKSLKRRILRGENCRRDAESSYVENSTETGWHQDRTLGVRLARTIRP